MHDKIKKRSTIDSSLLLTGYSKALSSTEIALSDFVTQDYVHESDISSYSSTFSARPTSVEDISSQLWQHNYLHFCDATRLGNSLLCKALAPGVAILIV